MTVGDVIFSALRSLVTDRCYPVVFPQELIDPPKIRDVSKPYPTWPAIRYSLIGADNVDTICGTDVEDTDNSQYQIDFVAVTYDEMKGLVTSGIAALMTTSPPCSRDFYFEDFDEETKTFRGILRITFYPSSQP